MSKTQYSLLGHTHAVKAGCAPSQETEEQIHTIRRPVSEATPPTVNWVGGDSALTSVTNGWDTAIALACSKTDYELTDSVYKWFQRNPEVCQYLLNLECN